MDLQRTWKDWRRLEECSFIYQLRKTNFVEELLSYFICCYLLLASRYCSLTTRQWNNTVDQIEQLMNTDSVSLKIYSLCILKLFMLLVIYFQGNGVGYDTVLRYDTLTDSWSSNFTEIPQARGGMGKAVFDRSQVCNHSHCSCCY